MNRVEPACIFLVCGYELVALATRGRYIPPLTRLLLRLPLRHQQAVVVAAACWLEHHLAVRRA